MIEDLEENESMDDEDLEYEKKKSDHWATLGIGNTEYYRF